MILCAYLEFLFRQVPADAYVIQVAFSGYLTEQEAMTNGGGSNHYDLVIDIKQVFFPLLYILYVANDVVHVFMDAFILVPQCMMPLYSIVYKP